MFSDLKAMVVVLVGASIGFVLLKPIFLQFMYEEDFARRRNLWLLLTAAGFLSPNIWVYILVAAPALLFAAQRDTNPISLWLLTVFVVPPVEVPIPTFLINQLFTISQSRLLSLLILVPICISALSRRGETRSGTMKAMDALLLVYGAYQLVLFMPLEALTNTMRRGFLYMLDVFVVYFAFSRALSDTRRMTDAMASLCLAFVVVAPLAVFESVRGWLLYTSIPETWGAPNTMAWLLRGDSLRSQLATGHSITMGYVMATALAFWFFLKRMTHGIRLGWAVTYVLSAAIMVSYARATWIMAALLPVIGYSLAPARTAAMFKGVITAVLVGGVLMATPLGSRIVELLPFVGTGDQDSVTYRQELAETSWRLIQQNPVFGNPYAFLQMENLRQGQGIIDIVNGYAGVALFQGLAGLSLFCMFYFASIFGAYLRLSAARHESDNLTAMGAALVACMVATLVFLATVPGAWLMTPIAGMLAAYTRLSAEERVAAFHSHPDPRMRMRAATA